jgi:hypothetical protein
MPQFGGKNAKKTSSDSKRHFTVVMGGKEHGLYVSSTPSSAARKAVTKLCAANKSKKVDFHIREITQGSKKKTYGPYTGYIEKLKDSIELKGRIIKYKPVAKKRKQNGGNNEYIFVNFRGLVDIYYESGQNKNGNSEVALLIKKVEELLGGNKNIKQIINDGYASFKIFMKPGTKIVDDMIEKIRKKTGLTGQAVEKRIDEEYKSGYKYIPGIHGM